MKSDVKQMFESGLLPGAAHRDSLRQLRSECKDELEYHQRRDFFNSLPPPPTDAFCPPPPTKLSCGYFSTL